MSQATVVSKRVSLVLKERADRFTGDDLLRISEAAGQAGAVLHISLRSWQVFVGVPSMSQDKLMEALREMGYDSIRVVEKLNQGFTLGARAKA